MRATLALLVALLPLVLGETDSFSAKVSGLKCQFTMKYKGTKVDTKKSIVKCGKTKKTVKFNGDVTSDSGNVFTLSLIIPVRGKVRITKASITLAAGTGRSGSGAPTIIGPGSG